MKHRTVTIIAFSAAVVCMAIAIALGNLTHTEPGYLDDAPRWERTGFPIVVTAERYTAEEPVYWDSDLRVVQRVVKTINVTLGFPLFVVEPQPVIAETVVTFGVPIEPDQLEDGKATVHVQGGMAVQCDVTVSSGVVAGALYAVVFHELGHCMGLAHDPFKSSIMYPVLDSSALNPGFTAYDREILREAYGPKKDDED